MYGHSERSVNDLRYKMYRASGGVIPGEKLPPCVDSLWQHAKRSNYQCAVWRRALEINPIMPSPHGHGWSVDENDIDIVWNKCSPALDEILYLLTCGCTRKCEMGSCSCEGSGLQCTDACHSRECGNMPDGVLNRELDDEKDDDDD